MNVAATTRRLVPALCGALLLAGCSGPRSHPERATRPYPAELHTTEVLTMQVFRDGSEIEIVNATPHTWRDVDLWVNQRYVQRVAELPAGATRTFSLWDFYDELGETMNAGGFFRFYAPTPVRLVEIQPGETQPMRGLVTIRAEREPESD